MIDVTFDRIHRAGQVVAENRLYQHVHDPELPLRYDSNYIAFKSSPSVPEFREAARYLREFHRKRGQHHVKFYFPANAKPVAELMEHLRDDDYAVGFLELYAIEPGRFPQVERHPDIEIQAVTEDNLDAYLRLQDERNLLYGQDFADQIREYLKRNCRNPDRMHVLALYQGVPAGSVDLILSAETVEIDNLAVKDEFQRKGIGSRLQKFVMDTFPEKTVILVADGEDTPREMYRKQNYQYAGFQYYAQKVYADQPPEEEG